jgi:hypothetical protein
MEDHCRPGMHLHLCQIVTRVYRLNLAHCGSEIVRVRKERRRLGRILRRKKSDY